VRHGAAAAAAAVAAAAEWRRRVRRNGDGDKEAHDFFSIRVAAAADIAYAWQKGKKGNKGKAVYFALEGCFNSLVQHPSLDLFFFPYS
jgi:hypothetical protein